MFDKTIRHLIETFSRLPSVGPKTAERFVFHLLKSGKGEVGKLTIALQELISTVKSCSVCQDFSESNPCNICSDPKRDQSTICVVAESSDAMAVEKTGGYRGTYHILRGTIDALEDSLPPSLKIRELIERIKQPQPKIKEVILALNPDIRGETTMLYIQKELSSLEVTVTRLARGLPIGADLAYADEVTLSSALKERKKM